MAYRKRSTHRRKSGPKRRRSRMGAIGRRREGIQRTLGLVGGAVLTGFLNGVVPMDKLGTNGKKYIAAGEVVLGYFLPQFLKGDLFAGVGDGLIAAGGLNLLHEFGVINGIPTIAGWRELSPVNGVPQKTVEQQNGDRDNVSYMYNNAYGRVSDR